MDREQRLVYNLRMGAAVGVVIFGILVALLLVITRPKTPQLEPTEPVLSVELQQAVATNLVVSIPATGIAQSIDTVQIAAEVGGRVLDMPRKLKQGDQVIKDELLLQLDDRDYRASLAEAKAAVSQLNARLDQLKLSGESDKRLLSLQEKSAELVEADFKRLHSLYQQGESVSISTVEGAERAVIQTQAELERLDQLVSAFPSRLQEAEAQLESAEARAERAELNLQRTSLRAPFNGRIVEAMVSKDSFVAPGQPLFALADDSELEIPVSISLDDLQRWISFDQPPADSPTSWFPPLPEQTLSVTSGTGPEAGQWTGTLDRVMSIDSATRLAMLAVRVSAADASDGNSPLVAGMFCSVDVPGRELSDVIGLPRIAVTFDGKAYISENGRLKTVDVDVIRRSRDLVFIRGGIDPGDQVVITRLVAPLEGIRLESVED